MDGQPGLLRLRPETRTSLARLVADLRRYIELGHRRPAGEVLYDFLRSSGSLARLMAAETAAAEEALSNIARFFEIVRAQSDLLADDRAVFLAPHLADAHRRRRRPGDRRPGPDADAVAVVDAPQGEGAGVAGRLPRRARRRPLPGPRAARAAGRPGRAPARRLPQRRRPRAGGAAALLRRDDPGPRRARARPTRSTTAGKRTRRVSPFVLEALDLPAGTSPAPRARPARSSGSPPSRRPPAERAGRRAGATAATRRAARPLLLPGRRLPDLPAQVPVRPRDARADRARTTRSSTARRSTWPSQEFHRRHARGEVMTEEALDRGLRGGLVERGLRLARARGGAPRGRPGRPPPLPRGAAGARAPSSRPTSSGSSPSPSTATGSAAGWTASTSSRSAGGPGARRRGATVGRPRPMRTVAGARRRTSSEPTSCPLLRRARRHHRLQELRRPRSGAGPRAGARSRSS